MDRSKHELEKSNVHTITLRQCQVNCSGRMCRIWSLEVGEHSESAKCEYDTVVTRNQDRAQ